jgi:membrane-bound lytic murein transglycosylase F
VRTDNPDLRASLNDFVRDEYRGLHFNVLRQGYLEGGRRTASIRDEFRTDLTGRLSMYDDLIRRYASACDLDWRLVAAQICQESRFDHERVSSAGAFGLMQLMPATAGDLGIHDPEHDAETSIRAGTLYLKRQLDGFEPRIPLEARIRFALASYNAGRGHVQDARRLAARKGWSPDRWYGHVEKAMLLLQEPEYYEDARYGYCRGSETVSYVRRIDRLYRTYVEELPPQPPPVTASGPAAANLRFGAVAVPRWMGMSRS